MIWKPSIIFTATLLLTSTAVSASEGPRCVREVTRALVGYDHPRTAYEQQINRVGALYDKLFPNWKGNAVALAAQQCNMDPALVKPVMQDELEIIQREGVH
jgi:hypothetical protein